MLDIISPHFKSIGPIRQNEKHFEILGGDASKHPLGENRKIWPELLRRLMSLIIQPKFRSIGPIRREKQFGVLGGGAPQRLRDQNRKIWPKRLCGLMSGRVPARIVTTLHHSTSCPTLFLLPGAGCGRPTMSLLVLY